MSEGPSETREETVDSFLEHYGVKGMKWGKRKAAERDARNTAIKDARGRQGERQQKMEKLVQDRLNSKSEKGKAHLDRKMQDLDFEIRNNPDAGVASMRTSGEKWMKAGKTVALLGLSAGGLGAAASLLGSGERTSITRSTVLSSSIQTTGWTVVGGKLISTSMKDSDGNTITSPVGGTPSYDLSTVVED